MDAPLGVFSDATNTYVADFDNNRVLVWNSVPPVSSSAADLVLGQPDGINTNVNNGGLDATSIFWPAGIASTGDELLIGDGGNARVKIHQDIVGTPTNCVIRSRSISSSARSGTHLYIITSL